MTCEHVGAHTRAGVESPGRGGNRGRHGKPLGYVQWISITKYSDIPKEWRECGYDDMGKEEGNSHGIKMFRQV
jgi:hypothetical protein